jgi:hypothetical protein
MNHGKKAKKLANNSNKNNQLISRENRKQLAEAICQAKGLTENLKYMVFWIFRFPIKEAAKLAGIEEKTAYPTNCRLLLNPKHHQRLPMTAVSYIYQHGVQNQRFTKLMSKPYLVGNN